MSEAIIARRKGGSSVNVSKVLKTETITGSTNWTVPSAINNSFDVRIFGGGGGADEHETGGGGGWMNNATLTLTPGTNIYITIGAGGTSNGYTGGTSSFGTYLSANGGTVGLGSSSGGDFGSGAGYRGYQFSGGGAFRSGGNGGTYGGAGGGFNEGGSGNTYGGGGGCRFGISEYSWGAHGGNGGTYGGGGGGGYMHKYYIRNDSEIYMYNVSGGIGGTYGGNGGTGFNNAEDGTNTSTWTNVANVNGVLLRGWGRAGSSVHNEVNFTSSSMVNAYASGGGGGFGGNGGKSNFEYEGDYYVVMYTGGGGGYGGHGGNNCGGGGGYFSRGGNNIGGGGGYGRGGDNSYAAGYGGGGGGYGNVNGGGGICIIQYYAWEVQM